ncbi:MAG: hypothetical protein M3P27_10135 [Acidobacteriota bacterium]|nr:hypothetical protein [Acidobacteriota bacterium]
MKRTMLLFVTIVLFALAAAKPSTAKSSTLTGCISGPNAENAYLLTNGIYKKGVEVGMPGSNELSKHVGNKVKLTGTWVKTGGEIGEKEDAAAEKAEKKGKSEKAEKHFKVAKIDHLADTCTMGGAGKTGGTIQKKSGPAPK